MILRYRPRRSSRDRGVIVDDRHARPLLLGAVEDIVALIDEPAERNAPRMVIAVRPFIQLYGPRAPRAAGGGARIE
jgi:hypothetical protein